MKHFIIVFILLIIGSFSILNAQASNLQQVFNEICTQKRPISSTKTITPQTPPKKALAVTKQRRLKSFRSNHRIARKRKNIIPTNSIASSN